MVWTVSDFIALSALILTFIFSLVNFIYTLVRTRSSKSKIRVSEIKTIDTWKIEKGKHPSIEVEIYFNNTGTRNIFLFTTVVLLAFIETNEKSKYKSSICSGVKSHEILLSSQNEQNKLLCFEMPEKAKNWKEVEVYINAYYYDLKGKKKEIVEVFCSTPRDRYTWIRKKDFDSYE